MELTTPAAVKSMKDNIRDGAYTAEHYYKVGHSQHGTHISSQSHFPPSLYLFPLATARW